MPKTDCDAPLMPAGSTSADLDIAQEQDALTDEQASSGQLASTEAGGPEAESEAHPS